MAGFRRRVLGRWGKRILGAVLALLVVVAALALIVYPTFRAYPDPDFSPGGSPAEQNIQDLAYLRHLPDVDRSFTAETRAEFMRRIGELEARAAELGGPALAMGVARAVAVADNAHTNVVGLAGDHAFNAVPFRFGWFADGLFVVEAAPQFPDLPGLQLLDVNGRRVDEAIEALRPYVGGPPNFAREFAPNFLISPELLHAAGLASRPADSIFQFRRQDGQVVAMTLAALPASHERLETNFWPKRHLSPLAPDHGDWLHVLAGVTPPPYLSNPDKNYWHDYPGETVLYVQLNRLRDQEPVPAAQYLSGMLDEAAARGVKSAIVDLRFNRGDDYTLATDFSRRLHEILPADGKLVILTSANTISAGISTAARLKFFAGPRAVIIGEAVGDRGTFWGEGGTVVLPNSNLTIRYATAYHDWENGCRLTQIRTCFVLNYFFGVAAGPLAPAKTMTPSFAEYAAGEDPVLAEAMRLANSN